MELPNLISVQKESFERFMGEGLAVLLLSSRQLRTALNMQVTFGDQFGDPPIQWLSVVQRHFISSTSLLTSVLS